MPQDIMFYLKNDFGICAFENGKLQPCNYHKNRSNATVFKLTDSSGYIRGDSVNQINHKRTPDILRMSKLFKENNDPAGGWYLVQEQREWLSDRLIYIFNSNRKSPCRILVAGIASYVHFYTYAEIVINSAKKANFDLQNISIDIVDKCIYPLIQIASIENNLRNNWIINDYYRVLDAKIKIPKDNIDYLKTVKGDIRKITTRLFLRDLRTLDDIDELGKYSIITEHFLTSMLHKQSDMILKTRKLYSKLLIEGGSLLVATGVRDEQFLKSFIEIHQKNNLQLLETSTRKVWDPYGIKREQFFNIEANEIELTAALDNCLLEFRK